MNYFITVTDKGPTGVYLSRDLADRIKETRLGEVKHEVVECVPVEELRREIAKNDGYVKTLAANVKEICELKEQLAHEKESHAATTRTWESRERHCGLLATELKDAKQQLAQAQAAWMEACLLLGPDYPGNHNQDWDGWHKRRHALSLNSSPQGWLSPDEAKSLRERTSIAIDDALNSENEAKRLENCISICEAKNDELCAQCAAVIAIQTDARADLLDRLAKAEALLRDSTNVYNPWWCERRDAFLAEQKEKM